jgi:hypothetical protein
MAARGDKDELDFSYCCGYRAVCDEAGKDHTLFRTSSADWVLSSRLALRFRGMLLEPRLHLAEGLEGLAQLRLIDGVDIVILDSA